MIKQLKIITRKEAIEKNLKRYFTGKPCRHGHLSEKKVVNYSCMECLRRDKKGYRKRNIEKVKEYAGEYRKNNKEKIKVAIREHYHKNKEKYAEYAKKNEVKIKLRLKKWREDNKEKIAAFNKEYKQLNKERYQEYQKIYSKQYAIDNKEKINRAQNAYMKRRKAEDPGFRTGTILRTRMRQLINEGKMTKHSASITEFAKFVVGLPQKEFLDYIEAQFYPHPITGKKMTWKNQGLRGWHLDHIKPVSKFDLTKWEEQLRCFHYSNIQPLWAEDNLKKSDKY